MSLCKDHVLCRLFSCSWIIKAPLSLKPVHKLSVLEMRILIWMSGNIRKDKIRNEVIHSKLRVATVEKKMESCLRWFSRETETINELVRESDLIEVDGVKRGRLRMTWVEIKKNDMVIREARASMTLNRWNGEKNS